MDKFRGIIKEVRPPKNVSKDPSKSYLVQEIIVQKTNLARDGRQFTNTLVFNSKGNSIGKTQTLQPGMDVEIEFYLNGREYTKQDGTLGVFVGLDVKDVVVVMQQQYANSGQPIYQNHVVTPQDVSSPEAANLNPLNNVDLSEESEDDDLPFMWFLLLGVTGLTGLSIVGDIFSNMPLPF